MKKIIAGALACTFSILLFTGCNSKVEELERENAALKERVKQLEDEKANSISGKISTFYEDTKNWVANLF